MSGLFHAPISAPAVRVEPITELCTQRYSRTLSDRNPHVRSSSAQIVPMADPPMHPADVLVIKACAFTCAALVVIFTCEWIWL